jgi:signal transduction histidine kinase
MHYKYFLHLEILSLIALINYLDINRITAAREINAVIVNISGRQRMLCQRSALFSLRLVFTQNEDEREKLRLNLQETINLMQKSHQGLIYGDSSLNLSGQMSPIVKEMYFAAPVNLNMLFCKYISEVEALIQTPDKDLTRDNPHLSYILQASTTDLLLALDAVVTQYQKESEMEQLAIDLYLLQLYQESITAQQAAQEKAEEHRKALEELQATQEQLIHAEKMSSLGQLVGGIAHEMNNPVTFIAGNIQYVKDYVNNLLNLVKLYQKEYPLPSALIQTQIQAIDLDFLLHDLLKVLSSIELGTSRISDLVRSLLNFTLIDQAKTKLVDIHECIDGTLAILQNLLKANAKRPTIEIVKEYTTLPPVECYPQQLNKVFINILSNAIDALEESFVRGKIRDNLQIRISTKMIGNQAIAVQIADNGLGITELVKKRMFDPFFSTKDVGKGTGLGLSISYQIVVEKHGGKLKCTSTPQEGAEFSIEIPLQQRYRSSVEVNQLLEFTPVSS